MNKLPIIEDLLAHLLTEVPDISAALIVDFNGFIVAKKSVKEFNEDLIGGIMTLLDQTLNRIKIYTNTELGSGSFVMDDFHLYYIELGKSSNAIFVLIGSPYSHLDKFLPYSHIIANQASLILNNFDPCSITPKLNQNDDLALTTNCRNIIVIGSEAVGKTALMGMYKRDVFIEKYNPTIGVSIIEKELQITNDINLKLNLFDLSGLKSFGKVRRYYYKYSHAILILFDYSKFETLIKLKDWIKEAQQFVASKEIPFIIIGNKIDIVKNREDIKKQALELAKNYNYAYFETSALTGEGINEVFDYLIMKKFLGYEDGSKPPQITTNFIKNLSEDEKIIFICKIDCKSFENINIPNVIEKNIINNIAKFKEISLSILLKKLVPVEKAVNRNIDREMVLKIIDKYVKKNQIEKRYIRVEKDLDSLNISNIIKQGNI